MNSWFGHFLIALALLAPGLPLAAQERVDASTRRFFKVEMTIRDSADASAKTSPRRYTILIDSEGRGTLRSGARVPYATTSFQPGAGGNAAMTSTQYQYMDAGVNIDLTAREVGDRVYLRTELDVSSVQQYEKGPAPVPPAPTVVSTRLNSATLLAIGKPATIITIDDPSTNRRFSVEATVTRIE